MADLTTVGEVEEYLRLGPERDREELVKVVAAVNDLVTDWIGRDVADQGRDRHRFGALMLAARIYRRRNSPSGVEALGEMGPVYVSRNDPDLTMLLGLGNYRPPRVG